MKSIILRNGDTNLSVAEQGTGQPVLFCNGFGSMQFHWKQIIDNLDESKQYITYDFRGHGMSQPAKSYHFKDFVSDLDTVAQYVHRSTKQKMMLIAWSLGADLVVEYAASHSEMIERLIIIDGAVPVPEPLLSDEADYKRLRDSLYTEENAKALQGTIGTPHANHLSIDDLYAMNIELDEHRTKLLELYKGMTCPITMIMAKKTAGTDTYAKHINILWRKGVNHLLAQNPSIDVHWIDDSHHLIFTHPQEVASIINSRFQMSTNRAK